MRTFFTVILSALFVGVPINSGYATEPDKQANVEQAIDGAM